MQPELTGSRDGVASSVLPQRICLLVLGMHRSGTSAMTRLIGLLGADLPKTLLGPAPSNERGHWESVPLVAHHDRLLERLGSRWDDWRKLDIGALPPPVREEAARAFHTLIDEEYAASPLFVVKDPRICRFAPSVVELLAARNIASRHILVLRNPLAVAASLRDRDGITPGFAALMWLRHVLDAEAASRHAPRAIVSYETVLLGWRAAMHTVGARLGIRWPCPIDIAEPQVEAFLSAELQHHAPSRQEVAARCDITDWVKAAYGALRALERDADDEAGLRTLDGIAAEFDAVAPAFAEAIFPELAARDAKAVEMQARQARAVDELRLALSLREADVAALRGEVAARDQQIGALRGELAAIKTRLDAVYASRSWRLAAPLRSASTGVRRVTAATAATIVRWPIRLGRLLRIPLRSKLLVAKLARRLLPKRVASSFLPPEGEIAAAAAALQNAAMPALLQDPLRRSRAEPIILPATPAAHAERPELDVSIVTYNSGRRLEDFLTSLLAQDYPLRSINLFAVDHGSQDETLDCLRRFAATRGRCFKSLSIESQPNRGFGAGHNFNLKKGRADWFLVSNVDLIFEVQSIATIVAHAMAAPADAAAWELRQKPYEHPKFYDFATAETAWCSGACTLFRRSAMLEVGGFEKLFFMYCEDVELSYRLRDRGWKLTYVPKAVVWHRTYDDPNRVKPLQFLGSIYGNFLIRMRYGNLAAVAEILPMVAALLRRPGSIDRQRVAILRQLCSLIWHLPKLIATRRPNRRFGIMGWDYEVPRVGAFHGCPATPARDLAATVSIVMRTTPGRQGWRSEAVASVLAQTYPRLEFIIVEDGADTARDLAQELSARASITVVYRALPKMGRAAAGNHALSLASGQYLAFLDDDDALFADHVETLVAALEARPKLKLVYGHAWEVRTQVLCPDPLRYEERSYGSLASYAHDYDASRMKDINLIPIQAALFRRELYDKHGGFDESLDLLEDWNLWLRYSRFADFAYIRKTTSMYRVPADVDVACERNAHMQVWYDRARSAAMEYAP